MGDRIQQVAGILFALAFVAILAMINTNVVSFGQSVNRRLANTYAHTESYDLEVFNNRRVTGATVISTIRNRDTLYSYPITVIVDNGGSIANQYGSGDGMLDRYEAESSFDDDYIDPSATYSAELMRSENGAVFAIRFQLQ